MRGHLIWGMLFTSVSGLMIFACSIIVHGTCDDVNGDGVCDSDSLVAVGGNAPGGQGGIATTGSGGFSGDAGSDSGGTGGMAGIGGTGGVGGVAGQGGSTSSSGGAGGIGGSGGVGGIAGSGGSGGSPPLIQLNWSFPGHQPGEYLGIAGEVLRPLGPDLDPAGNDFLPGCIANASSDPDVTCDVGPYEPGTVLSLGLNGYDGSAFLYFHCNPPGPGAKCQGILTITIDGTSYECDDVDPSPCVYDVGVESNHLRFVLTLP